MVSQSFLWAQNVVESHKILVAPEVSVTLRFAGSQSELDPLRLAGLLSHLWSEHLEAIPSHLVGGDWNMTGIFVHRFGIIIPFDFHIFQRG